MLRGLRPFLQRSCVNTFYQPRYHYGSASNQTEFKPINLSDNNYWAEVTKDDVPLIIHNTSRLDKLNS